MNKETKNLVNFLTAIMEKDVTSYSEESTYCPVCGRWRTGVFTLCLIEKRQRVLACAGCVTSGKVEVVK